MPATKDDGPPRIRIEVCFANGRYKETQYAPSKYSAKQMIAHLERNGFQAKMVPPQQEASDAGHVAQVR